MRARILSLAFGGSGVAKPEGKALFIPGSLPGEEVSYSITKDAPRHAFARLEKVWLSSPQRSSPSCKYFQKCPGCQFQHLEYVAQLEVKRQFVIEAFERIAKIKIAPKPTIPSPSPYAYRENIRLNINSQAEIGYISKGRLFPINDCPLYLQTEHSLQPLRALVEKLNPGKGSVRLFKGKAPFAAFSLPSLPKNYGVAKAFLGAFEGITMKSRKQYVAYGKEILTYNLLGLEVEFSPYGFMQNNHKQAENLYRECTKLISSDRALELYCGTGNLSLLCAQEGVQMIGVDSNRENIKRAKRNAMKNGLSPQFYCGDAEKTPLEGAETIILNPPRDGLSKEIKKRLITSHPRHILYISCMPPTLARDCTAFLENGYTVDRCIPLDMFPQTTHVETILSLRSTR